MMARNFDLGGAVPLRTPDLKIGQKLVQLCPSGKAELWTVDRIMLTKLVLSRTFPGNGRIGTLEVQIDRADGRVRTRPVGGSDWGPALHLLTQDDPRADVAMASHRIYARRRHVENALHTLGSPRSIEHSDLDQIDAAIGALTSLREALTAYEETSVRGES